MREYEMPKTAKELRHYLGMINFYRRVVPKSTDTLQPLYDLIKELNSQLKNKENNLERETISSIQ